MLYREPLLGSIKPTILNYISSMDEDKLIACEVLEVLEAHVEELKALNLIPVDVADRIIGELRELKSNPSKLFTYDVEDIHEAIEVYLREKVGPGAGYLALGRSRNDHVAAALRLKIARMLVEEALVLLRFRRILLSKASSYIETLMPLYTHSQPAQISTIAHYLLYVDELLSTYLELLPAMIRVTLKSPLGAGPVAGVMAPIDRTRVASKLFDGSIVYNSIYASSSRDFMLLTMAFNVSLLVSLSRIVEDLIVFSMPQLGYIKLPEDHLSTSSIMPHKRNPVTLEIARAKAAEALGYFVAIAGIIKGLMSGYNLDLQEANKHSLRLLSDTLDTLRVLVDLIERLEVNPEALMRDIKSYPIVLSDVAELIAMKTGRPFREVHRELASLIKSSNSLEEVYTFIERTYGVKPEPLIALTRPVTGSPRPEDVKYYVDNATKQIQVLEEIISRYASKLNSVCSAKSSNVIPSSPLDTALE